MSGVMNHMTPFYDQLSKENPRQPGPIPGLCLRSRFASFSFWELPQSGCLSSFLGRLLKCWGASSNLHSVLGRTGTRALAGWHQTVTTTGARCKKKTKQPETGKQHCYVCWPVWGRRRATFQLRGMLRLKSACWCSHRVLHSNLFLGSGEEFSCYPGSVCFFLQFLFTMSGCSLSQRLWQKRLLEISGCTSASSSLQRMDPSSQQWGWIKKWTESIEPGCSSGVAKRKAMQSTITCWPPCVGAAWYHCSAAHFALE